MESVECSRKLTGSPNCCSHWACEQVQQIHSEEESQGMGRGVLTTLTTTVSDGVCPLSVPSAGSFTHSFSFHPHNLLVGGYEPHSCPQLPRGTAGLQSQVPLRAHVLVHLGICHSVTPLVSAVVSFCPNYCFGHVSCVRQLWGSHHVRCPVLGALSIAENSMLISPIHGTYSWSEETENYSFLISVKQHLLST